MRTTQFGDTLSWLIYLRYHAVAVQFCAVVFGLFYGLVEKRSALLAFAVSASLLLFNIVLHRQKRKVRLSSSLRFIQLNIDLLAFSLILLVTSPTSQIFYIVYTLHVLLGAVLLSGKQSLLFFVECLAWLWVNQVFFLKLNPLSNDDKYLFVVQHVVCFACWFIVRSLSKQLEKESLRASRLQLFSEKTSRLRELGALASGFSHEFASPLNTLKLRLERMGRHNVQPQVSDDFNEAILALQKCERILKSMHGSLTDFNDGSQRVRLNVLVQETLDGWLKTRKNVNVQVSLQDVPELDVPILAFQKSFINLLENAIEANSPNGVIQILLQSNNQLVSLCIQDSGQGFDPLVLERIGEPFNTSKPTGVGLGFFSAYQFMQAVGGRLVVRNPTEANPVTSVEMQFLNV